LSDLTHYAADLPATIGKLKQYRDIAFARYRALCQGNKALKSIPDSKVFQEKVSKEATENEIKAWLAEARIGELLGPAKEGQPGHHTSNDIEVESHNNRYFARQFYKALQSGELGKCIERVEKEGPAAYLAPVRDLVRKEQRQVTRNLQWPKGKYRIIYADPPWDYNKGKALSQRRYGEALKHYPTMQIEEIAALPVPDLCTENSVLFLWATMPKLPEALQIMDDWGFDYKTGLVWDKVKHNWGYYFSMRHELLLVGGRQHSTPDVSELADSVVTIERSEEHSEKPSYFRELIDRLYPKGPRIELFARTKVPNWEAWGHDV